VDRELQHQGLLDLMDFEQISPPDAGPASNRPSRVITESAWWQAYCLCGWASPFRDSTVALRHLGTCRMARSIRRNRQLERETEPLNNGSPAEEHNEGRGASLLSCGDIEANPGPGDPVDPPGLTPGVADGMQLDAEGMQMLMALADVMQQPNPLPLPPIQHNQPITWDSLLLPADGGIAPEQHTIRPQRTGGRRRRAPEPVPVDLVHVPPPEGNGPPVLDSDVDLAHAAHSGPAV
jgi:hypothetical protein